MSYKEEISKEDILEIFDINPVYGTFTRKKSGKKVSYPEFDKIAMVTFSVRGKTYKLASHILIWLICYNEWPSGIVFHKDFNQFNLGIGNLMLVSHTDNYKLLAAYKNLKEYCDIKLHPTYNDTFLVRYVHDRRLKYEQHHDLSFAQAACKVLKEKYKRFIIQAGAIPPL